MSPGQWSCVRRGGSVGLVLEAVCRKALIQDGDLNGEPIETLMAEGVVLRLG